MQLRLGFNFFFEILTLSAETFIQIIPEYSGFSGVFWTGISPPTPV